MSDENRICEAELDIGNGLAARVRYTLLQTLCETDGARRVPVYGIRAEMFTGDILCDSDVLADITADESECLCILNLLAKNTVTPVALRDVVEDYLGRENTAMTGEAHSSGAKLA